MNEKDNMNIEEIMIEWNNINGLDGLEMSQMRLDGDERDKGIKKKYIIRIIKIQIMIDMKIYYFFDINLKFNFLF